MLQRLATVAYAAGFPALLWVASASSTANTAYARHQSHASPRDSIVAAILRFEHSWGEYWRASESERHWVQLVRGPASSERGRPDNSFGFRAAMAACSGPIREARGEPIGARIVGERRIAWSASSDAGVCPSWYLGSDPSPPDEAAAIDAALTPRYRALARDARAALLRLLSAGHARFPNDGWLAGQHVRYLLDQDALDSAGTAAARCRQPAWWCTVLGAYVHARMGSALAAEAEFAAAVDAMPPGERCVWQDTRALIASDSGRRAYAMLSCAQRDSINANLWWLSDPWHSTPGNERLLAHHMRQTEIRLRTSLDADGRFGWRAAAAGDARREMLLRYGWPTYSYWTGYGIDHTVAASNASVNPVHGPANWRGPVADAYPTAEYSHDRLHFVPEWTAVTNPFGAQPSDWELHDSEEGLADPRRLEGLGTEWRRRSSLGDSERVSRGAWWPVEHIRLQPTQVQLPGGQLAFFRREQAALVAVATELQLATRLTPAAAQRRALLLASARANAVDTIGSTSLGTSGRVAGWAPVRGASVFSVELLALADTPGARLRIGILPPAPLRTLAPQARALSDPVFLAPSAASRIDMSLDSIVSRMLPRHDFARGTKLAIYWESYGFLPTDTVSVAVWVQRYTPQSAVRRLGIALNLADNLNAITEVRWEEPRAVSDRVVIPGRITTVGRHAEIDVGSLIPGDYWLTVAIARAREPAVQARRGFSVR